MAQGMRILPVMAKYSQASRVGIEAVESAAVSSDPKRSGVILTDGADSRIARAVAVRSAVVDEVVACGFVAAQAAVRAHPDPAAVVGKQGAHRIGWQWARVLVAMAKVADITG